MGSGNSKSLTPAQEAQVNLKIQENTRQIIVTLKEDVLRSVDTANRHLLNLIVETFNEKMKAEQAKLREEVDYLLDKDKYKELAIEFILKELKSIRDQQKWNLNKDRGVLRAPSKRMMKDVNSGESNVSRRNSDCLSLSTISGEDQEIVLEEIPFYQSLLGERSSPSDATFQDCIS